MSAPVNLTELREITDGDPGLERELFSVFLQTSEESLRHLQNSQRPGTEDAWRRQAHSFKGAALNLGAERLGKLCKYAQDHADAGVNEKARMLLAMQEEFSTVRHYIETIHST